LRCGGAWSGTEFVFLAALAIASEYLAEYLAEFLAEYLG